MELMYLPFCKNSYLYLKFVIFSNTSCYFSFFTYYLTYSSWEWRTSITILQPTRWLESSSPLNVFSHCLFNNCMLPSWFKSASSKRSMRIYLHLCGFVVPYNCLVSCILCQTSEFAPLL